jgi:hypothetical protein
MTIVALAVDVAGIGAAIACGVSIVCGELLVVGAASLYRNAYKVTNDGMDPVAVASKSLSMSDEDAYIMVMATDTALLTISSFSLGGAFKASFGTTLALSKEYKIAADGAGVLNGLGDIGGNLDNPP